MNKHDSACYLPCVYCFVFLLWGNGIIQFKLNGPPKNNNQSIVMYERLFCLDNITYMARLAHSHRLPPLLCLQRLWELLVTILRTVALHISKVCATVDALGCFHLVSSSLTMSKFRSFRNNSMRNEWNVPFAASGRSRIEKIPRMEHAWIWLIFWSVVQRV